MKVYTSHCDLCGAQILSDRGNGWMGSFRLKRNGNSCVPEELKSGESDLDLCNDCGNSVIKHVMSLRSTFSVKCTVEKQRGTQ